MRIGILAILLLCSCSSPSEQTRVLVSVPPIKYLVEKVGGEEVEVSCLVPAGADLHTYEPTPIQVGRLESASLWFRLGEPVEERVLSALESHRPDLNVINLCSSLELIEHSCQHAHCGHGADLHVWMSPCLDREIAQIIAQALIELIPSKKELFEENLANLERELEELSRSLAKQLEPCKGETILVSHPAFGYFCREYGLKQLPVEIEGKEPSPQQLARLLSQVEKLEVKTVLIQRQYSNKGALLIARRLDIPTCTIDPLEENIPENLRKLAQCICP